MTIYTDVADARWRSIDVATTSLNLRGRSDDVAGTSDALRTMSCAHIELNRNLAWT